MKVYPNPIPPMKIWPILCLWILSAALSPLLLDAAQSTRQEGTEQVQSSDPRVEQMLSIAESQYEIVKLLIQQGRFERVLPEMRKIFELKLPIRYDEAMARSASLAAHLLVESRQYVLAHEVLNEAFPKIREVQNQASLLKIQAYVYKSEGKLDAALETLERAVALEKQRIRP